MNTIYIFAVFAAVAILPTGFTPHALAQQQTFLVYVEQIPDYATMYTSHIIDDAIKFWKSANPKVQFSKTDTPEKANLHVQWIRDYGSFNGLAGEYAGNGLVQIGLGDSNCLNNWQPYSSATIIHITEHEIGHFLGLGHVTDPNNIMYPTTSIQYGVIEIQKDFVANYSWFIPMCTQKNGTSFSYSVATTDPKYGFDVYFVPSQNEFVNWSKGQQFQYYSGVECYAKRVLSFNGTCNGIVKGSGLMIIMPNQLAIPIATISVKMEERTSSNTAAPTITSFPSLQPPVSNPLPPPLPQPTPTPTTNFVKVDQNQILVSVGETSQVKIYGKVNNTGGGKVVLTVTMPDSTSEVLQAFVTHRGDFSTPFIFDKYSLLGKYQIQARYGDLNLGSIYFNATSKENSSGLAPIQPAPSAPKQSNLTNFTPQPQPQPQHPVTSYFFPSQMKVNGTSFTVPYTINGSTVTLMRVSTDSNSLFVILHPSDHGVLTLLLPRQLIDSQKNGQDQNFFVTSSGQGIPYEEISSTPDSRIITINFSSSTGEIQITGTHVLPEFGSIVPSVLLVATIALITISTRTRLRFRN